MQKVKNTIPVYDICTISGADHGHTGIVAKPFAEYLRVHPNLHRPHGHSFYHILLFTKGAGYHTIDFERYPVEYGQIYFMAPGQVHSWTFEGEVDGFVINFDETFFHEFLADHNYLDRFHLLSGLTGNNVMVLKGAAYEEAVRLFAGLVKEVTSKAPNSLDLARVNLIRLFILADRLVPNADPLINTPRPN